MIPKPRDLPIPTFYIDKILRLRDKLNFELGSFVGSKMVRKNYSDFVSHAHQILQHDILRVTVSQSLQGLLNSTLTESDLAEVCWRLAGNTHTLQMAKPVRKWTKQFDFEWVPMRICNATLATRNRELVILLTFEVLAGSPASMRLVQYWTNRKAGYLAVVRNTRRLGFGFGRSKVDKRGEQKGELLYRDYRQWYGLRCYGLIDPNKSQDNPYVTEIGHSFSTMKYNQELIHGRIRRHSPCIKGYPRNLECTHCYHGVDQCRFGTHEKTFVPKQCVSCGKLSLFDPSEDEYANMCVNCTMLERTK